MEVGKVDAAVVRMEIRIELRLLFVVIVVAVLGGNVVEGGHHGCQVIARKWWKNRVHFRRRIQDKFSEEARTYCHQWDDDFDGCLAAPLNVANGAYVGCTIEGHGNHECVPSPCAFLNNGFCTPEMTGGFCQWFERIPDPKDPNKSRSARGCYRNPCHLSGREENNRYYCEHDPSFRKRLNLFFPRPKCAWCPVGRMGCQNMDTSPKAGCESIRLGWLNKLARENARNGKKVGSLMVMKVQKSPDSPYVQNTPCWDREKTFKFSGARRQIECLYGIHPMCHPDLGYEWKYAIRDPNDNVRLLHEGVDEEEYDIGWTLQHHGHTMEYPFERIQGIASDD